MTGLLLVLTFVLALFVVVQFVLQETITGQESALGELSSEVTALADALGLERDKTATLERNIASLTAMLEESRGQVRTQAQALRDAEAQITGFEAEIAALLAAQAQRQAEVETLEEQLQAVEVDRDLFRQRLTNAQDELTAMALSLEAQLQQAEETLTLLAAAQASEKELTARLAAALAEQENISESLDIVRQSEEELQAQLAAALAQKLAAENAQIETLSEADRRAALLAQANRELAEQEAQSADDRRSIALLNEQVAALRTQLAQLESILDASEAESLASEAEITALGNRLNTALAQLAQEESRRRQLEEQERLRLEAENRSLERYRSEFLSQVRDLLENQEGVEIVGDRFVFSSEVLFATGEADISDAGKAEIAKISALIRSLADEIPADINWVLQVDGHTDDTPLSGSGTFADNWELSQARALSVVRYMVDEQGLPPERLSANGYGEYQPLTSAQTPQARAQNRRIELKFTEK